REARATALGLQLPAHLVLAPAVLEHPRSLGPFDLRLRDARRGRPHGRELHRACGAEVPISVEWRPLAELRRIGQRLPDLRRRMTQISDENKRALVYLLAELN